MPNVARALVAALAVLAAWSLHAPATGSAASGAASVAAAHAVAKAGTQASFLQKPTLSTLFDNNNIYAVENGPSAATRFTLRSVHHIERIRTYHWNNGRGVKPGSIRIIGPNREVYGPWPARGLAGQGGVPNAYWEADANVLLGPGTYTILDSDFATWSQNAASSRAGFALVVGYPVEGIEPISPDNRGTNRTPPPPPPPPPPVMPPSPPLPPPAVADSQPTKGPMPPPFKTGSVLASATIGPSGGTLDVPGRGALAFPPGAVKSSEVVEIREMPDAPARARLLQVGRAGGGNLVLAKPVTVTLAGDLNRSGTRRVPVSHLDGPLFVEVPGSRVDPATGTLTFEVSHFSPLGEISSADVKAAAGGAVGVAIGIYLVTPAGVLTLPGLLIVGGLGLVGGGVTNPVVDAAAFARANMTAQFGDRFRIHWVSDRQNPSNLADEEFAAFVRPGSGEVIAFEDAVSLDQRGKLLGASVVPNPLASVAGVSMIRIPKCVVYTAAELFWAQTFYQKAGFATPDGGADPMPRPMEVLILTDPDNQGLWDGTKLNLDSGVVARLSVIQKNFHLTRQAVIAHEYWHSVFTFAGYRATFDWWNEAQAVAFESEVFPDRNIFSTDHPAPEVAVSLRTGFATTGTQGSDADWSKRGYKLWPWGKFLLNRGYRTAMDFGRAKMSPADISRLFDEFSLALLSIDRQLPDRAPVSTPADSFNRGGYVIQFPEGMDGAQFSRSTSTSTGWNSLNLDRMRSPLTVGIGDASLNRVPVDPEVVAPRPLSFVLFQATVAPSKAVTTLAAAKTPPPLVVRREIPAAAGEKLFALHPTAKDPQTARRRLSDLAVGQGAVAVPATWFDWSAPATRSVDLATVRSANSASGRNPLWTYFLLPPSDVKAEKSENQQRGVNPLGTISIAEPQIIFTWKHPELGPGLTVPRVLKGYRVFTQKGPSPPSMVKDVLLPTDEQTALVPAGKVGPYDRIGLASEDAVMKDAAGEPLLSPVQWFAPGNGSVTVIVSEVNPDNKSPFAEDIVIPIVGASVSVSFVEKGQPGSRSGTTDKNGTVTFDVPLDVPVTVTFGKQTKSVTCTAVSPRQSVGFGGLVIQSVPTIKR